jgi:hypothetical protein
MDSSFALDPEIAKIAETYARDAVNLAAKVFRIQLDFADGSVKEVEAILTKAHGEMAAAKPPEDVIWTFAKGFGSYIGEVLRKNHGGEWGTITDGANSSPGIRIKTGAFIWPWARVHQRLVQGAENNVWHYYQVLVREP